MTNRMALVWIPALCAVVIPMSAHADGKGDDDTLAFSAEVRTQSISATEQVGTFALDLGHGKTQACTIHGQIVGQTPAGAMLLQHTITCPTGTMTTNDTAYITGAVDQCTLNVFEQNLIVSGTKRFHGMTGSGTAVGTINVCTGQNAFTVTGVLTKKDD